MKTIHSLEYILFNMNCVMRDRGDRLKFDIIIIGAGAAGLASAYYAITHNPQLNILVLEKESLPGRKLNASGNGKCNLTNSDFKMDCYHSDSDSFIKDWYSEQHYTRIVSFFEEMGILLYEKGGYYYPISNQAKQVSSLLYEKSKSAGVDYRFSTKVTRIHPTKDTHGYGYQVVATTVEHKQLTFDATYVLLATGGCASAKLGGCKDGYQLAKDMGISCNAIYPVLSPMYVEDKHLTTAKGVRLDANVTLRMPNGFVYKESGQIQFNDNNLSGIVMMNMSCYYNKMRDKEEGTLLHIDVLPQYNWDQLKAFFVSQKSCFPTESFESLLKGILPGAFVSYLTKRIGIDKDLLLEKITDKHINRITSALKKLEFTPVYVEDFDKAQVTGGGISTDAVSAATFESNQHRNLYIVGEVLDVNGKCGGYNLTFAILSGIQAVKDMLRKGNE